VERRPRFYNHPALHRSPSPQYLSSDNARAQGSFQGDDFEWLDGHRLGHLLEGNFVNSLIAPFSRESARRAASAPHKRRNPVSGLTRNDELLHGD
jgi:hypothetical protein